MTHIATIAMLFAVLLPSGAAAAGADIQATVSGQQRVLAVAVRFPGTSPMFTLEQIQEKIGRVEGYVRESSYGKAWLETRLVGWYDMPAPVDAYKVSQYLLVENRQKVGGDAVLPAAGMLVLEVDPTRPEGTAIVRTVDASPAVPKLYGAPFRPGAGERRYYENAASGVAIVPLEVGSDGSMRILVTTPERGRQLVPMR